MGRTARKYRFSSRAAAEDAYTTTDRMLTVTRTALNDALAGDVRWVKKGIWKIGICRPTSACGGVVIVVANSYASAHYLEEWTGETIRRFKGNPPKPNDQEMQDLQEVAYKVRRLQRAAIEEEIKQEQQA